MAFESEVELALHSSLQCGEVAEAEAAEARFKQRRLSCPLCGEAFEELALHLQFEHEEDEGASPPSTVSTVSSEKLLLPTDDASFVLLSAVRTRPAFGRVRWCAAMSETSETRLFRAAESWGSCGYRNAQSMLSAARLSVPDLTALQHLICQAWRAGFDARSRLQLGGDSLIGSRRWIGACECLVVLRNAGRRAFLVEFEPAPGKKKFDGRSAARFVAGWFGGSEEGGGGPLFVQWKGHSVLVVGVADDGEAAAVWDPNAAKLQMRGWNFLSGRGTVQMLASPEGPPERADARKDPGTWRGTKSFEGKSKKKGPGEGGRALPDL